MAGAYLLRALTEFGAMPPTVGVAIGLLYAVVWLLVAARQPAEQELATVLTSGTSMLIMGPLVWEALDRLKVMPTWAGAAVLVGFACLALAVSWRKGQILISGIACVSSTLIAAALLLATRDLLPFTLALLAIAAVLELAAWRDHPTGSRWFTAITADAAVLVFSWLMARENGLPEGYVPTSLRAVLAAQLLLMLIYVATAVTQSVVRRRTLSFFEIAQTASALLIGIGGIVWVFRSNGAAMVALGISGLIGGLACYLISFLRFDRSDKWNFRAWATFGLSLVLAGTFLPFSGAGFWALWCGCCRSVLLGCDGRPQAHSRAAWGYLSNARRRGFGRRGSGVIGIVWRWQRAISMACFRGCPGRCHAIVGGDCIELAGRGLALAQTGVVIRDFSEYHLDSVRASPATLSS